MERSKLAAPDSGHEVARAPEAVSEAQKSKDPSPRWLYAWVSFTAVVAVYEIWTPMTFLSRCLLTVGVLTFAGGLVAFAYLNTQNAHGWAHTLENWKTWNEYEDKRSARRSS